MSFKPKIKIKNFGVIKATNPDGDGWLEINKVTVFIGDQGSGKSTIAKLISTFMWIEKALFRGDYNESRLKKSGHFKTRFLSYHRLENYLKENTEIHYQGNLYSFKVIGKKVENEKSSNITAEIIIKERKDGNYTLPQLMYIPSERNFISYVVTPKELNLSSDSFQDFLSEFIFAKQSLKHLEPLALPIQETFIVYDKANDILNIKKENDYNVRLSESSSGFQSLVPAFLVSNYLANLVKNNQSTMNEKQRGLFTEKFRKLIKEQQLTDEQIRLIFSNLSDLSETFNKKAFINIVEEPEQNLFPNSQWEILKELLKLNNQNEHNQLILTTHSPYIVNYLSIAIKAQQTYEELIDIAQENLKNELHGLYEHDRPCPAEIPTVADLEKMILDDLGEIIPLEILLNDSDVSIYQLKNGFVDLLPQVYGIPSDDNYLNNMLLEGNQIIDSLMEIEDEYREREFL